MIPTILKNDCERYLSILGRVAGESEADILKRRTYPYPQYRAMLTRALILAGYAPGAIMEAIGRNRTMYYHYMQNLADMDGNPTMRPAMEVWENFVREAKI